MLLTALVKRQLKVFAVLTVAAVGLLVFSYARVPAMVGIGVYDVTAEFDDVSGLYPKALVTYRGVKVGQVSDLELTPTRARVTLRLDSSTTVPADVRAEVRSTSAVGEQFIDLVPQGGDSSEALAGGDRIRRENTRQMPQITPVLESANRLLESVPEKETAAVLEQVDTGLGESGDDVGDLIDASRDLVDEARDQIEGTTGLIRSLRPVLTTQQELAGETRSYARSLRRFTDEVAAKDDDLRALVTETAPGIAAARGTVNDLQTSLPMLLQNLTVTGSVLSTYLPQLEQIFVVYPATVARLQSTVNPRAEHGDVQLDLRAALNDPPPCSDGYLAARQRRSPSATDVREVNPVAHCEGAPQRAASIRGARNLPCPTTPARGALPASCGLRFGSGVWPTTGESGAETAEQGDGWKDVVLAPVAAR